jgi:hypothetical protein
MIQNLFLSAVKPLDINLPSSHKLYSFLYSFFFNGIIEMKSADFYGTTSGRQKMLAIFTWIDQCQTVGLH